MFENLKVKTDNKSFVHCVYVYEFKGTNHAYVGRTDNITLRHWQHKNNTKDTVRRFAEDNNITLDKLNKVRKELNIKDKELQKLQYQLSISNKTDTVVYRDTIFKEGIKLDTLIKDDWYSLNLDLEYPSTIIVNPKFKSEKYVVTSLKKEIKGTPKKCWLGRIFQKKHNVIRVEVVEKSPYIETKEQVFINIIEQ